MNECIRERVHRIGKSQFLARWEILSWVRPPNALFANRMYARTYVRIGPFCPKKKAAAHIRQMRVSLANRLGYWCTYIGLGSLVDRLKLSGKLAGSLSRRRSRGLV